MLKLSFLYEMTEKKRILFIGYLKGISKKYKGRIPGAELLGAIAQAALQGEVELDITRFDDRELVGACDLVRDVSPELCGRIGWEKNLREAWKHFLRNHPELESEELRFEG